MAIVKAFRGVRYDLYRTGAELGQLACPPYDVMSPARQRAFHERHPENFVHVDFGLPEGNEAPGGTDIYARAAALWSQWLVSGILKEDGSPRFYLYRQNFAATVGGVDARFSRLGLVASVHAEEFGGHVLPHERTLAEPKEDRFRLAMSTRAQLGQVFFLYDDPEGVVEAQASAALAVEPLASFLDDESVEHLLWELTDADAIARIEAMFLDKDCLIADGHHRYETSLRIWKELDPGGRCHHGTLATLVNRCDPGLVVRPIHRIYRGIPGLTWEGLRAALARRFSVEIVPWVGVDAAESWLAAEKACHHAFLLRWKASDEALLLKAPRGSFGTFAGHGVPWSDLDLAVLQQVLQEEILGIDPATYPAGTHVIPVHEPHLVPELLDRVPENQFAVLVNPTSVEEIAAVARSGERMPQKSTYFHPKIWSGLVSLRLPS
jgi:uncharacterized protein (DUF1015 family)